MKAMILIIGIALSSFALAQGEHSGKWEEKKTKKIAKMEERIARATKNRDCLKAANTKEAFKACMKTIREDRKSRREAKSKMKNH